MQLLGVRGCDWLLRQSGASARGRGGAEGDKDEEATDRGGARERGAWRSGGGVWVVGGGGEGGGGGGGGGNNGSENGSKAAHVQALEIQDKKITSVKALPRARNRVGECQTFPPPCRWSARMSPQHGLMIVG